MSLGYPWSPYYKPHHRQQRGKLPFRRPCLQWQDCFICQICGSHWAHLGHFPQASCSYMWPMESGPILRSSTFSPSHLPSRCQCPERPRKQYVAMESRAPPAHHLDFTQQETVYMKSLKPPGFPFTTTSMTLTNKPGETRGNFLKLSPCDAFGILLNMTTPFYILLLWGNKFHNCLKTSYMVYLCKICCVYQYRKYRTRLSFNKKSIWFFA